MPTIGEVYNPLIDSRNNPNLFNKLLIKTGQLLLDNNPSKCTSLKEGIEQAKNNLNYYCQYFDNDIVREVKIALGKPLNFIGFHNVEIIGAYDETYSTDG